MRKLVSLVLSFLILVTASVGDPVRLDRDGEKWAEKTLKKMSLEEKVGQMFMVWARVQFTNINSPEYKQLRDTMTKYHLGGFGVTIPVENGFLQKSEPLEAAALLNQLQKDSKLPLLFAADFERGLSMRLNGVTGFPHAMAFGAAGDRNLAYQFGKITGDEARAIGVRWNWFPDADVNSNPNNPIINTRSFSESPQTVSEMVKAYIEGAHVSGMLTTAKHFPGHGDTDTDTHLALAKANHSIDRLEQVELPPFKTAIDTGVDAVMVAHVLVPALDPDPNRPASISEPIINGLLKKQMGFKGLVMTDAMDMGAMTKIFGGVSPQVAAGKAAVEAVKAGNDMLIIPPDLDASYKGIVEAVKSGEIPESRINESVLKILKIKASLGLNKQRFVKMETVEAEVSRPENLQVAQQVADEAVTLVLDNKAVLPLKAGGTFTPTNAYMQARQATTYGVPGRQGDHIAMIVFVDDVRAQSARMLEKQMRMRLPESTIIYIDESTAAAMSGAVMAAVEKAEKVVAVADIIPTSGRTIRVNGKAVASVALPAASAELFGKIVKTAAPKTVVASMGNPYVATNLPGIETYLCTFSNVPVSDLALVKAMFGEIPIKGHLPVTIPGVAARGAGIELPAVPNTH